MNRSDSFTESFVNAPGARAILARDWASTPLGAIDAWPSSLKVVVGLLVRSAMPMALLWGERGTLIYNEGFAPFVGDRHPTSLGSAAGDVWPEAAEVNVGVLKSVLVGESRLQREQDFLVQRAGAPHHYWLDIDYSPVVDSDGSIVAALALVTNSADGKQHAHRADAKPAVKIDDRKILDSAVDYAIIAFDLSGKVTRWNEGARRMLGWSEDEVLGQHAARFLGAGDQTAEGLKEKMRDAFNGTGGDDERWQVRKSGERFWVFDKMTPIAGEDGAYIGFVKLLRDQTEKRRAELALAESAAQSRTLSHTLPALVWTATSDGRLDWFNERVYQYCGAIFGVLNGPGWTAIVHPQEVLGAAALWHDCVASGERFDTEFRLRRADGEYRWHLARAEPLRQADGTIIRWFGTYTDIHERKLSETASTRDRDRIWTLSQELMLICDYAGVVAAVNPAAMRLLGWSAGEMIGKTLSDFVHPDDIARTAAEVEKLGRGVTTLHFENRYRGSDGAYRLLSWTAVPDGGMIHAVGRDVSRERSAEEALRQSQKLEAIGHLTGGVAHDFNNVLAVIRTSIDLIRLVPLTDTRRTHYVDAISDAVTRAGRLTGQLLAFARRQTLQPVVFDVGQNITLMLDMIATLTGARIALESGQCEQDCFVNADPSQFDTAIINLAVNARDAMPDCGRLTITVTRAMRIPATGGHPPVDGDFVAVSIADTGCGIRPEHMMHIFEPFFTTKDSQQGTGLGLSQVFGFTKQSGGDVLVDSAVGQGSVFTLYLPHATASAQTPAPTPDANTDTDTSIARGNGGRILIVEDNAAVARSVEQTLEELGYATLVASSGEQALVVLADAAAPFAAVFSDVVMAGISGIELGEEIRRLYPALPVVLSSGYSYVLAANPDHGFTLLSKPYPLETLARTMHDAVAGSGAALAPRHVQAGLPDDPDQGARDRELFRQAELDALQVLDSDEEAAFDELTSLAAAFFKTPVALITLIDADRQWFKSRVGTQMRETPRQLAFCDHAIRMPDQVMVINDATKDTRFADNPLVTDNPNIRFYAGAPLVTSNGYAVGTLCILDLEPRELQPGQIDMLRFLAGQVIERLEARKVARNMAAQAAGLPAAMPVPVLVPVPGTHH